MNFAVALTGNKVRGAQVDIDSMLGTDIGTNPQLALDRVETGFLAGQVSDSTRDTFAEAGNGGASHPWSEALDDPVKQVNVGLITGLVLGSPEFQKR